jgi:long-chain-fatty-acid--[acyl-carrier-protein] ligase
MFWKMFARLCLFVLSLRYKIETRGLENITRKKMKRKGGILFLPNHVAHLEPVLVFSYLWPKFKMRPLVIEYVYRQKFLQPLMKAVKALPIPNFDTSINQIKIKRAERSLAEIGKTLREGANILLYPSGKLKTGGKEILAGASGAHTLLKESPDANVVLIRTSGFWGSSLSRAIEGRSPDIGKSLWQGVKTIIKNMIFFCPRRKIVIEFELEGEDFPREASRVEFNRYLEHWFNQYVDDQGKRHEEEPIKLVSYTWWKETLLKPFHSKKKKQGSNGKEISSEIREKIYGEIRRILDNPGIEIRDEMNLAIDLGLDSLNIAELLTYISSKYDVEEIHPEDLETIRDALEISEGARNIEIPRHQPVHIGWPKESNRLDPHFPVGRTIPEIFLLTAERMKSCAACGDDLIGVLSYKKMKRAALVLAEYFRTMEGTYVAVLLPASAGAYLTILAIQLAGKVPVMLNWTLGPRYLEDMMRLSGAREVISSWRFLERLSNVEFGNIIDHMQLLEDIKAKLTLRQKLRGLFLSMKGSKYVLSALNLNGADENAHAVVLFTSGTEASPKGVPLSHKNILSNLRAGKQCIDFTAKDVLYGILPPFHSFGFSIAGLFSILCGMRIAFYPDPTDSFALAEGIKRWKVTIFCSAPSFLRSLFSAAKNRQLESIRLFISGAEKAPQELYEKVKKLGTNSKLVEGYGITECSPVLTINRLNLPPKGVGMPLPETEMCMIHLETEDVLPPGVDGEICVRGPNIFNGYLDNPRSPFIELNGKKWYRTGDIGHQEPDGTLILSGRLKRFTKIGGEMISLSAIEEVLLQELMQEKELGTKGPSIAILADERNEFKTQLVLFTTFDFSREKANDLIQKSGFSRLIKISSVQKIEEIPLLGTGKTDYRTLQSKFA